MMLEVRYASGKECLCDCSKAGSSLITKGERLLQATDDRVRVQTNRVVEHIASLEIDADYISARDNKLCRTRSYPALQHHGGVFGRARDSDCHF